VQSLSGKKIATSYPVILGDFLKDKNVEAEIHEISGSVEIAPGIGLADAICDLVSSGSTLFMNGLKETETILTIAGGSLIRNKELSDEKQQLIDRLLFRIQSVKKAKNNKYILLNAPNEKLKRSLAYYRV
jgi:ATP phosphoribosyltransferase